MKIPRYWAKESGSSDLQARNPATGEKLEPFSCWGWSDISIQEAKERARQRTKVIEEKSAQESVQMPTSTVTVR